jgi:hypothetical protein
MARNFSFECGPEIISLAPGKVVRETGSREEKKKGKGKVQDPPRTFEEILRGMDKALGPTALMGCRIYKAY